jgi:hypothetical protein
MTTYAQNVFKAFRYVEEATPGVTPNTPTMISLRKSGGVPTFERDSLQSNELNSDAQSRAPRPGVRRGGGNINVDWLYGEYDNFLEGLLLEDWDTNVLVPGTTRKTYTIEIARTDIGKYLVSRGNHIQSLALNIPANALITGSFGLFGMATGTIPSDSPLDASPTDSVDFEAFDSFTGELLVDTTEVAYVASLTLNITRTYNPKYTCFQEAVEAMDFGKLQITGTLQCLVADHDLFTKFINTETIALQFDLGVAPDNVQRWYFPDVKLTSSTENDAEESTLLSFNFEAFKATEDYMVQITRIAADFSDDAGLTSVLSQTDGSPAGGDGSAPSTKITWAVNVANGVDGIAVTDIVPAADATAYLYSDVDFLTRVYAPAEITLSVGANNAYIKVVAQNQDTLYYGVVITRAV